MIVHKAFGTRRTHSVLRVCALSILLVAAARAARPPENLALKATASVSTHYSDKYVARFACDGKIPKPISRADIGQAWVAKGNNHPDGAIFTLTWPEHVTVAELVYYGRTGWVWNENWKDYEVYVGDAKPGSAKPLVKGKFVSGHGPQRVKLPAPVNAGTVRLRFLNHYGGPNPGASEIQVYAVSPPDSVLGKFIKPGPFDPGAPPPPSIKESPALAARLKAGGLGFEKMVMVQRHHIRCSHVYTYHCEGQKNGGALGIYDLAADTFTPLVDSSEGQILGCDLSYDGKKILFSWRRAGSPFYQLYSVNTDGTELAQLTEGEHFNYDGCWLPDGRIVFLSSRVRQAAYCFFTPVGILFSMNADGSNQRQISANYLNDFTPAVMNDGRIVYGRWEYVDRPAIPIQGLWTINPDGTMLQGYFGNRVLDPATFIEPRPIPGSKNVLCTLTGHNGSCRGAIGIIDPAHGNNAQESIRNLTPEVRLRGVTVSSNGPRGPYQTPYPVDEKYFLVSRDGTILLRDYDGTEQAIVLEPRGLGFYNPQPSRARPAPPVRASTLPDKPAGPWAVLYMQDVYNGLEPHLKRGEVRQLAIVQEIRRSLINSAGIRRPVFGFQRVLVSCGATYVPKRVIGYADVDPDGSAYFKVPAGTPLYFIALDAQGRGVQRMRSFTHLMPGETQSCVGCHEPRTDGPQRRPTIRATGRPPQDLAPPEWGAVGFNYASIVQPVLDKHCVRCHNPHGAPKGLDLSGDRTDFFNVSYEHLARKNQGRTGSPYISWIPTYNGHEWNILEITPKKWGSPVSKLADIVVANHPDAEGKPRVALSDAEQRRVLTWIDLNVPYYATADTAHPELPACRQMLPTDLRKTMDDVFGRRCVTCHDGKKHRVAMPWRGHRWHETGVRIENPHLNAFLLSPLAREAGGTGRCGKAVFASKDDADYQAVLETFVPIRELAKRRPRMDMPGAVRHTSCDVTPEESPQFSCAY